VLDLLRGPARSQVGALEQNLDELERVALIDLRPIAEREPHRSHEMLLCQGRDQHRPVRRRHLLLFARA